MSIKRLYLTLFLKIVLVPWMITIPWGTTKAVAQERHGLPIRMEITDSLISTRNGELLALILMIENREDRPYEGVIAAELPAGMSLLSPSADDTIRLKPQSKRFIPIRIRVNQTAASGRTVIRLRMGSGAEQVDAQTSVTLQIEQHREVQLLSSDHLKLMRHLNDSISVSVQLRNTGNIDEIVHLVSSVPTISGSRRYQQVKVHLPSGRDTLLNLGFVVDKELFGQEQFRYNIAGLYEDQRVFGNLSVSIQNASSSRNFQADPGLMIDWGQRHNHLSLSGRNPFTDQQTIYMDANLQLENQGTQWELNSHLYQWGKLNQTPVLTNTWLAYTRDQWTLTAGQIVENSEKYIQGRGGKVNYTDSIKNYQFSVGMVDKSYDLLNQYGRHGLGNGLTAFSNFESGGLQENQGLRYRGRILYDRDPLENTESMIHTSVLPLLQRSQNSSAYLALEFGAGLSRAIQDTLKQHRTEPGFAIGVNYDQGIGRFYIQSNHYYSTAHYPGIRRGTLNLHQRLGVRYSASNLWLGYRRFDYEPASFIRNQPRYYMMSEEAEMGFTWQISPFSSLSIVPHRYREKSTSYAFSLNANAPLSELVAYRGKGLFNWRSRNNQHFIHLNLEGSVTEGTSCSGWNTGYRGNLNYNFWKLNLNLHYQEGAFSVFDVINMAYNESDNVSRMTGALNFNYFTNRNIQAFAGLQYYRDNFTGSSISSNIRTDWKVGPQTVLFSQAQYYQYKVSTFGPQQSLNFHVGVSQSLQGLLQKEKTSRGTLQIRVYFDENGNQQYDPGEKLAVDKSILVGKSLFLTDSEGWITYRNMPYGIHEVQIPLENGWHAPTQILHLDGKSKSIHIGLQRSGMLRGKLELEYDPRLDLTADTDLEGYVITAKNQAGQISQTRSNAQGEFLLFLPTGSYTISLNEQDFPENIYAESIQYNLKIESGKLNELPPFILKVQERKIEVKRFGTSPTN